MADGAARQPIPIDARKFDHLPWRVPFPHPEADESVEELVGKSTHFFNAVARHHRTIFHAEDGALDAIWGMLNTTSVAGQCVVLLGVGGGHAVEILGHLMSEDGLLIVVDSAANLAQERERQYEKTPGRRGRVCWLYPKNISSMDAVQSALETARAYGMEKQIKAIIGRHCLDYVPLASWTDTVRNWKSILAPRGQMVLTVPALLEFDGRLDTVPAGVASVECHNGLTRTYYTRFAPDRLWDLYARSRALWLATLAEMHVVSMEYMYHELPGSFPVAKHEPFQDMSLAQGLHTSVRDVVGTFCRNNDAASPYTYPVCVGVVLGLPEELPTNSDDSEL